MGRKLNILVIHVMNKYPMRATLWDQLYCFRQYSDHNCFYLNLYVRSVPWYLNKIKFDVIVFGTVFLANRVKHEWFEPFLEKARALKGLDGVKVALPQDEHSHTNVLMDFLEEFAVDAVFSVGPETEWTKLYDRVDFQRVKFFHVLTGYLSDPTLERINRLAEKCPARDIDIGYRTWLPGPWLGRHGMLRQKIAEVFERLAPARGLSTDISMRSQDTLWGDAWYEFLLRCKFTISVEGGSSVPDKDGMLRERIEDYQRHNPHASFEEVEQACFPGLDGTIEYVALSPRHLEACATRTCQVLVEGRYNGILQPGRHYLELKRDFSNVEQVLRDMQSEDVRNEITEHAYRDIVASGQYTYLSFVESVLKQCLQIRGVKSVPSQSAWTRLIYLWMRFSESLSWMQIALHLHSFIPHLKGLSRKALVSVFSERAVVSVRDRVKAGNRKTD